MYVYEDKMKWNSKYNDQNSILVYAAKYEDLEGKWLSWHML